MTAKNNGSSIFGIILILALLGLSAYLWFSNAKLSKELSAKKTEFLELEKLNTELDFNYQAKLEELEGLRGDNQELNAKIDTQKSELAKQKKRISGLIWTEKELGKARSEMENLQAMANKYIAEITELKNSNQFLASENQKLTESNTTLNQEVTTNKKMITELDSVQTLLVSAKEELEGTNEVLSSKVHMAEAIKINSIAVTGYDVKDDGTEKPKSRAKKVDMLRACLTTETNMVTPKGEKEFFIVYTSPSGEVLFVEELGSGLLVNELTGEELRYTTSGTANYEQEELLACLDWTPNFALQKGVYKVEIFQSGFPVGDGEFKLK